MPRYDIAGIHFEINSDNLTMFNKFKPFIWGLPGEADVTVSLNSCRHIPRPNGNTVLMDDNVEWLEGGDNKVTILILGRKTREPFCKLDADSKWSRIDILYLKDSPAIDYAVTGIMFNIIIRNRILFHQGIVIHASAIEFEGKGVIFSAPSGTGKSTQARIWETNMGARVINDDCPVLKTEEGRINVWGTPCSGSKDKFLNLSAPLSGIVVIRQASENTIRSLSKTEAILHLMPRCFLAYHDKRLMDMAMDHLERIISKIPVYLLNCRPDREAMELVYRCIK